MLVIINFSGHSGVFLLIYSSCLTPCLQCFFMVFILGSLQAESSQEAFCSFQDSNISEQNLSSSAQQPCSHSEADVMICSQEKNPEAVTTTSQSTLYIDLSQCSTPTQQSESVEISGLQIYKDDVQTVKPKSMITDTIVLFLFKQLPQIYPIVSSFFYTTLCGEQDVGSTTSSLHWLLAVLTPWHFLILDSLTWDISTRHEEIHNINRFLDHLCAAHSITSMTSQRSNYVLKVPQQLPGSNNCGFHILYSCLLTIS
ncbi:uncharacterized protein [Montipora capricornis]|uniref:uncharacterized protein isoform X3 n=1 Tax=Montipora capricornis TaxID=246305 RepID=UPI0035F1A221